MKNPKRQTSQLEKKLTAYSLAGAAALVAPGVANASIVYVPVNQTVNEPGSYNFNLSGPASNDITVTADRDIVADEIVASAGPGASILLTAPFNPMMTSHVAALAFGALIDPGNPTNWGSAGKMASNFSLDQGTWPSNGTDAYLGFYFTGASGVQAGWADIATTITDSSSSFTVLSYAYQTEANTSITAGAGAPVATPEPSAIPLLVLGGAGLIALRRRRAANA